MRTDDLCYCRLSVLIASTGVKINNTLSQKHLFAYYEDTIQQSEVNCLANSLLTWNLAKCPLGRSLACAYSIQAYIRGSLVERLAPVKVQSGTYNQNRHNTVVHS